MQKSLRVSEVMEMAKCSKSTAIEIVYTDILESKKLYLNRKNNSTATVKFLEKNFEAKFTKGNDAPRGGKFGDFVTFTTNDKFDELAKAILGRNEERANEIEARKVEETKAVNEMVITEEEKNKFLEKTKGMSNKSAKAIASNFAGRKLGFYNNIAKDKFMALRG